MAFLGVLILRVLRILISLDIKNTGHIISDPTSSARSVSNPECVQESIGTDVSNFGD